MRNFVTKFGNIHEICKKFAGNHVNEKGNVPRCGVVPTFSDLEVVALSITAEAMSIDSENYLFKRLNTECPGLLCLAEHVLDINFTPCVVSLESYTPSI